MGVVNKTDGRSSTSIELTDTLRILMNFAALLGMHNQNRPTVGPRFNT